MILFVGRQADNIVDIQIQSGPEIKQLFVTIIGNNDALTIEVNHMHEEFFEKDIEAFHRAGINPSLRAKIEEAYPRHLSKLRFNIPTVPEDLSKLVDVLKSTIIDMALLEQTVVHDTESGQYKRGKQVGKVKGHRLFRLLGR